MRIMPLGSMTKTERTVNGMLAGARWVSTTRKNPRARHSPLAVEVGEVLLVQHVVAVGSTISKASQASRRRARTAWRSGTGFGKSVVGSLSLRRVQLTWRDGSAMIGNWRFTFESSLMLPDRPRSATPQSRSSVTPPSHGAQGELTRQSTLRGT